MEDQPKSWDDPGPDPGPERRTYRGLRHRDGTKAVRAEPVQAAAPARVGMAG